MILLPGIIASGKRKAADPLFDAIMARAPTGYWRLDETSGTTAFDSSGNGNHGAYVGPQPSTPGLILAAEVLLPGSPYSAKKYPDFSGSHDSSINGTVRISDVPLHQITSGTIMCFTKMLTGNGLNNPGGCAFLFGKQNSFAMYNNVNGFYGHNSLGFLAIYDEIGSGFKTSAAQIGPIGGIAPPRHIALKFAMGVTNGSTLYLDGVPVFVFTYQGASGASFGLSIADSQFQDACQPSNGQNGECAIFNTLLADADIAAINAAGR